MKAETKDHVGKSAPGDLRKSAESLVADILDDFEFEDVLRAMIFEFHPVHNQHQQCQAIAKFTGKDKETVRRWMHGLTSPSARDFWPIAFVAILQKLPVEVQREIMTTVVGGSKCL